MKKYRLILILLFFLLTPIFSEAKEYTFHFHQEFDVGKNPSLYLDNLSGKIIINSHLIDKIIVDAIKVVKAKNFEKAKKASEKTKIKTKKRGSDVIIHTKYPKYRLFRHERVRVNYHILVPEETEIDLKTTSADIDIERIKNNIDLSTTSGNIRVEDTSGDIFIKSTSGDISLWDIFGGIKIRGTSSDIELNDIEGDLKLDCTSGDVEIKNLKGDVEVSLTSGDLTLQRIDGDIDATSSSGDMEIFQKRGFLNLESISGNISVAIKRKVKTNISKGYKYSVGTVSGDVYFYIPEATDAKVKLETVSGKIHTNLPLVLEDFSRKHLSGKLGSGESKIHIFTTSGDIKLKEY